MTTLILALILLVPIAAAYFLKSNGSNLFFSACVGFVLVNLASSDIGNLLHRSNIKSISPDTANLILVFVPTTLTMLLSRKHTSGKVHLSLSLIAAATAGGLMILTTAPFFSSSLSTSLNSSWLWTNTQKIQAWIIGVGALASFIYLWLGSKSIGKHKK